MKKSIIYIIVPAVIMTLSVSYYLFSDNRDSSVINGNIMQHETKALETFVLKSDEDASMVKIPGEIIADRRSEVYAKVLSYVKTIRVDIGSEVRKGDLLIEFEAPELISQLASLRSKIISLESQKKLSVSNYNRILKASKTEGSVSELSLEKALSQMESDIAMLESIKADYDQVKSMTDYLTVRAPFPGVITERNADIGNLVGPNGQKQPLLVLQDNRNLRLQLSVAENYAPLVSIGDTIQFTVRSLKNEHIKAAITRKAGALDIRLRSELIEADLRNSDSKLLPGMVADVNIRLNKSGKYFNVPKSAIKSSDKGQYVVKISGSENKPVFIKLIKEAGMMAEITGDLNAGDMILSNNM